jgi:hypothetical protein
MAEVLLQQASEGDDSDDEDNASSAESESSIHLDQLKDSYQDAQDPFAICQKISQVYQKPLQRPSVEKDKL